MLLDIQSKRGLKKLILRKTYLTDNETVLNYLYQKTKKILKIVAETISLSYICNRKKG